MINITTKNKRKIVLAVVSTTAILFAGLMQPQAVQAQYNYSPYNGSSNWLWLTRSFVRPMNRYSSYNSPFYLANSLFYGATYAGRGLFNGASRLVSGGPNNNSQQQAQQQIQQQAYSASSPAPNGYPRNNNHMFGVADQSVSAQWIPPARPNTTVDNSIDPNTGMARQLPVQPPAGMQQAPVWVPLPGDPAPGVMPQAVSGAPSSLDFGPTLANSPSSPSTLANPPQYAPYSVAGEAPPLAPNVAMQPGLTTNGKPGKKARHKRASKNDALAANTNDSNNQSLGPNGVPTQNAFAPAATQPTSSFGSAFAGSKQSPLARGFIHLVQDSYGGDIGSALAEPDMRRYAKAIGLLDNADIAPTLSPERSQIIHQILSDDREDAAVRVSAAKMLLQKGTQTAATGVSH